MEDNNTEKLEVEPHVDLETALDKAFEQAEKPTKKERTFEPRPEKEAPERQDPEPSSSAPVVEDRPEAPAEFNSKERKAWEKGDLKGVREAWDRVNSSRQQEMYKKDNEYKSWKNLAERLEPSIKAAGLKGKSADQYLVEAINLLAEAQKDPYKIADEIAKVTGFKKGENGISQNNDSNPQFLALQEKLDKLLSERENEKTTQVHSYLGNLYQSLQNETNEGGTNRYPGLHDDDIAIGVGSLIRSPDFQRVVQARIPNAGPKELILQAYRAVGGEVIESTGTGKSQSQQSATTHSEKARKASISQPGRSVHGHKSGTKKFGSVDDALDAAINDLS